MAVATLCILLTFSKMSFWYSVFGPRFGNLGIIQNSYSYFPAWVPIFFHSNTIEPSEIFKLTSQHLLFFLLHAGPFLFMIDISLDFGEVLKQAAVGVSDLWLQSVEKMWGTRGFSCYIYPCACLLLCHHLPSVLFNRGTMQKQIRKKIGTLFHCEQFEHVRQVMVFFMLASDC